MLIRPSVDELEFISEDRYLLATLAAKRARDLAMGLKPLTEERCEQNVSRAVKEMNEKLITYREGE